MAWIVIFARAGGAFKVETSSYSGPSSRRCGVKDDESMAGWPGRPQALSSKLSSVVNRKRGEAVVEARRGSASWKRVPTGCAWSAEKSNRFASWAGMGFAGSRSNHRGLFVMPTSKQGVAKAPGKSARHANVENDGAYSPVEGRRGCLRAEASQVLQC